MSKKKCPEFENHERWLVSYADMVTLLFAVFVVLYALNLKPESSAEQVAGSMQDSFNKPLDDIPVDRQIGPTEQGFGIFDHFRGNTIKPPLSRKFPGLDQRVKDISNDIKQIEMKIENRLYGSQTFEGSKKPGEQRIVSVKRTGDGIALRLLARHFYGPGDYRIRRQALKELDKIVKIVKEVGRPVAVEGHTDDVPPNAAGVIATNWELSALRATNVLRYMISRHHFPSTKISASGYADMRPVAHNGTESGRALNRRIELKIRYDDQNMVDPK
jgi:chemotaxis protein MotB